MPKLAAWAAGAAVAATLLTGTAQAAPDYPTQFVIASAADADLAAQPVVIGGETVVGLTSRTVDERQRWQVRGTYWNAEGAWTIFKNVGTGECLKYGNPNQPVSTADCNTSPADTSQRFHEEQGADDDGNTYTTLVLPNSRYAVNMCLTRTEKNAEGFAYLDRAECRRDNPFQRFLLTPVAD